MPEKLYGLTEADRKVVEEVVQAHLRRIGNTVGRAGPEADNAGAPDVYVALTPSGGIPARGEGVGTGTGTGSGCDYDEPGYAECAVYRVLPPNGTGSHDCDYHIEAVESLTKTVFNLSTTAIGAGNWIVITRDKFGSWFPVSVSGGAGSEVVVIIYEHVGAVDPQNLNCSPPSDIGQQCYPLLHIGIIQEWNSECLRWDDGDCVLVVEINGRTMERGVRYKATRLDATVESSTIFPVPPCQAAFSYFTFTSEAPVYAADIGDVSRVVLVSGSVGRLCDSGYADETNPWFYYGSSQRWNPDNCAWDTIEENVYIADYHGNELVIGDRYQGHYDSMISADDVLNAGTGTGTGSGEVGYCLALYMVHCPGYTGTRTTIAEVKCEEPGVSPPGDVSCTGLCIWQWVGSQWLLSFTDCSVQCGCPASPNFEGLAQGQEEIKLCVPPSGGGGDSQGRSMLAVWVYEETWECGELISVSGPTFGYYAGCCACASSGDEPGTGDDPPFDPGGGTGTGSSGSTTGTGDGCEGYCYYIWSEDPFGHWELSSQDCTPANCDCYDTPPVIGAYAGQPYLIDCRTSGGMSFAPTLDEVKPYLVQHRQEMIAAAQAKMLADPNSPHTVTRSGRVVNKPRMGIGQAGQVTAKRKSRCQQLKSQGLPCPDDPSSQRNLTVPAIPQHLPETPKRREIMLIEPPANPVWSYGVTTVPSRRTGYLRNTLASLKAGGFDRPTLFVDGDADHASWSAEFGLTVHCRPTQLGVVGAWMAAALELYLANPRADRFAIFQDDFTCYKNLKGYLDRCKWPVRGYLNLYTFTAGNELAVQGKPVGWHESGLVNPPDRNPNLYQTGRGAVALVFDRDAIMALLSSPGLIHKPSAEGASGKTKIDGAIVTCMNNAGFREYVHNPSLVQHAGTVSSRPEAQDPTSGAYRYGHMRARTYRGDDFDAMTLLEEK